MLPVPAWLPLSLIRLTTPSAAGTFKLMSLTASRVSGDRGDGHQAASATARALHRQVDLTDLLGCGDAGGQSMDRARGGDPPRHRLGRSSGGTEGGNEQVRGDSNDSNEAGFARLGAAIAAPRDCPGGGINLHDISLRSPALVRIAVTYMAPLAIATELAIPAWFSLLRSKEIAPDDGSTRHTVTRSCRPTASVVAVTSRPSCRFGTAANSVTAALPRELTRQRSSTLEVIANTI